MVQKSQGNQPPGMEKSQTCRHWKMVDKLPIAQPDRIHGNWHIYLHEWLIFDSKCRQILYQSHGSYGNWCRISEPSTVRSSSSCHHLLAEVGSAQHFEGLCKRCCFYPKGRIEYGRRVGIECLSNLSTWTRRRCQIDGRLGWSNPLGFKQHPLEGVVFICVFVFCFGRVSKQQRCSLLVTQHIDGKPNLSLVKYYQNDGFGFV